MPIFHSRWTTVAGLRTHDRFCTASPGLPVVFVHGLAVSHRYLLPTARALAGRHPVLVPDLPGFGRSDKPPAAWDVTRHGDHLGAWLDTLGLGPVCLAGHSFGAEVVARLAADRPALVAGLVLAGPTADPVARSRSGLIRRFLVDMLVEAPAQAPMIARDALQAGLWRVLATVDHSVRNRIEDDLARLPVRPLILGGELDPIAPLRWRASVTSATGGVAITIPRAAHNVMTTSGRRSADAIAGFLSMGTRRAVPDRSVISPVVPRP
ncbi:putative alpha/beta hydrolase fold protein [Actinoplanes missouriensis 431]|uniref:Putative alpha/beta hydrolase fold protein n=1 Tax=Actinoplanes missouriensis (strain ATCC 14538 / DSM 43046 / CBS 188.64 / JCM 3121 / NBRC 102363 / NCIMB 12654 / NRRL B-3342 / UNCC 431) TaxID=512565 RepID=I0HFH0_ACTM4|nr:alpha/beta fold hydrolase [Actinoplanes missouriensis]BAL91757.1 putative alpha/beta hydrolase fold protein [Actinoplanes missouriensis 431]